MTNAGVSMARGSRWLCLLLIGAAPAVALAEGIATPWAAAAIEHNTNVFDLSKDGPALQGKNRATFGDRFWESRAGIEGVYLLDLQKFFATAEARRFNYENFTKLNHNEVLLDGGLSWKVAHTFDGLVEYRHEARMVQFLDLPQYTNLVLESDDAAKVAININATPEWRFETRFNNHRLNSPRNDIPGLSLHENSVHEGLRYLGVSNLSAGIDAEYLEGKYNHDAAALTPDYHQTSLAMAANYIVSGFTNFAGNVGYTRRTDPTMAAISALSGSIGYQHLLTGKTAINLQLSRAINSYISTAGSQLVTSASLSLAWQATYKVDVKGGFTYINSKIPQATDGNVVVDRVDHLSAANVEINYQAMRWLKIRAYGRYQIRRSNEPIYAFNGSVVGIEFVAKELTANPLGYEERIDLKSPAPY